jgi:NAD(P)-dependent dehydrogenase (short-subunit alcohol dehydrogenase family)
MRARGDRVIGVDLKDADLIADLSTPAGCAAMADGVSALVGSDPVDVVIANAGVLRPAALCYAVNYHGAIGTLAGLRPLLARSSAPRAVVTASLAVATVINPGMAEALEQGLDPGEEDGEGAGYSASKLAIARWVRRMATSPEWGGSGILLNAICPGLVETPMQQHALESPSVVALVGQIPLKRTAKPRELAEVFAFLASEANSYVNGQLLYVDGGLDALFRPQMA